MTHYALEDIPVEDRTTWHPSNLQCKMVGRPILQKTLDDLNKTIARNKRMKAAHDKGRCWKRCVFCGS